ncbi:MAG: hypothetical protein AAB263_14640, partial [Planctomycetota bacterium]
MNDEQEYVFFVRLTDLAGNTNTYAGTSDVSRFPVRIDKVAPSCAIDSPAVSGQTLGTAEVPGGNYSVTVGTSSDVSTNGVSLTFGAQPTQQLTPSAPSYQATHTYSLTGTATYAIGATCSDIAGNATAASGKSVTIDLDAPTCAFVTPTSAAPYATNSITTTLNISGAEGRSVSVTTRVGAATSDTAIGSLTVASGQATGDLTYPNGTQVVSAAVSDSAGNSCTVSQSGVVVSSTACDLALTSTQTTAAGVWHNRNNTGSLTASTGVATVTANSANCLAGETVSLVRTAPTAGTPVTATTDGSGNVSFSNVALSDGETYTMTITNMGATFTTSRSFSVALVAPTAGAVSVNSTAIASGGNTYFVASADNRNVETAVAGYFADSSGGTDGAQSGEPGPEPRPR